VGFESFNAPILKESHAFSYEELLLDGIAKWPGWWCITFDLLSLSVEFDPKSHIHLLA